jgi:hypothetical protein
VISHKLLGTKEWFVIHHTDCGMEYFADDELAELLAGSLETAELTQTGFRNAGAGGGSPEGRYVRWLSIRDQAKSVIEDVWRIRTHPLVNPAIPIYGYIYDVKTGRLNEVREAPPPAWRATLNQGLRRFKNMSRDGNASRVLWSGRLVRAQRQVELSRNALNYATLEADADGVISATYVEPGQVVASGQAAVRLARLAELEASVALPETFVERARDATGSLTLWSLPGRSYGVKLRELSPAADNATRTYSARYTILDSDQAVRLGMSATLTLSEGDTEGAARVPVTAVFNHGRGPCVWVVNDAGKLTARDVTIARFEGPTVLLTSGVTEGENVVAIGVEKLDAGLVVRPIRSLSF